MWVPNKYINNTDDNSDKILKYIHKNTDKLNSIDNNILKLTSLTNKNHANNIKIYTPYVDNYLHVGKHNITMLEENKMKMIVEIIFKNENSYKIFPFGNEIPGVYLETDVVFENGTVGSLKIENNLYVIVVNTQQDRLICNIVLQKL